MLRSGDHVGQVDSRARSDMTILDRKPEREQVWPGHGVLVPEACSNLVELLRQRAEERPQSLACAFLNDGGRESERLSYAELDREARRIAAWLQASRAQGDRALLLFPAGLDFLKAFFGCLYAGVIAIPAPPPEASRLKRTLPRLRAIAADAGVSIVITNPTIRALVDDSRDHIPGLEAMAYLDLGAIPPSYADSWQEPKLAADDLAYLQYTSGSTTSPKGVMISHRNVVHHCGYLQRVCEYTPDSISMTWLPYFHDYGLIEGLLEPIYNGTPGYAMSPFSFLKRPFNWLQAISLQRATHTQAPNFAYEQCVRRIKPDQLAQLDLNCMRSAGNGAEPINPRVLHAFYRAFAPCGFRWEAFCPAYGLAETTLMVSCCSPSLTPRVGRFRADALALNRVVETTDDGEATRDVVSCGRIVAEFDVAIVNPDTQDRCAADHVGEIWVSDPSVAQGYWRRDDETETTFRAYLPATGEGPFLRTGDLGFIRDGELFVTSRIKDLIIVAGANHYPQDIEWTVEKCHPDVRPSGVAAFSIPVDGDERLVVAAEIERGSIQRPEDTAVILEAIKKAIAEEHEVPVHALLLLARGSLPKTASGKVQRHGCWRLLEADSSDVLASWITGTTRLAPPAPSN
jgi:acyl-CoA synthetase (AMP-forming)/AMP-acid ligase II